MKPGPRRSRNTRRARTVQHPETIAPHPRFLNSMSFNFPRILLLAVIALTAASCAPTTLSPTRTTTTRPAPTPTSTDLANHPLDPLTPSAGKKATLLLFITDTCPLSNAYAPDIRRLYDTYAKEGIAFYLVYADPDLSAADARKHHDDYAFPCPALLDPKHDLVHRAGASVTPEAAVFLPDGQRIYLGRIDDRPIAYAQSRTTPTSHDLQNVLDSITHNQPVTPRVTKAIGCYIPALPEPKSKE